MSLRQIAFTRVRSRKWTVTKAEVVAVISAIAAAVAATAAIASYFASQRQVRVATDALNFQKEQFAIQRQDDQQKAADQRLDDLRHERQHAAEIERALQESHRNATAAEKSVSLTQSSLDLQKAQFQEAQRAWVVFKGVSIGRKFELDKPGLFLTTLTNQSPSVAIGLKAEGTVKIGDPVTKADLEALEHQPYSGAQTDLGQHIDEQIPSDSVPITSTLVEKLTDGRSTISYYGKYSYSDQFGRPHEDHWCAYFIYNAAVDQFGQANCKISTQSPRR